jgi:hypothetical protein
MRKLAICCLVLAVVSMFAPAAQAGTKCYHLTYFCDGLETTAAPPIVVGLWDWVCLANNTGTLIAGTATKFGSQPIYPYVGGTGSGFDAMFVLHPTTHTFDLIATSDGFTTFAFQLNSPYTTTKGKCNPLDRANSKRPPAVLR